MGSTIGVRIPAEARFFSFLKRQTGSGAHIASYPMGTGAFPREQSGRGVKLTTHLHLMSRLRMLELYLYSSICLHVMVLH
jgi:hypothetical protein